MKKLYLVLIIVSFFCFGCQKSPSLLDEAQSSPTKSTFQAKLNGQLTLFNVASATLARSAATNQKRIDLQGVSADGTFRLIITIGEPTAIGNAVTQKKYTVRLFNDDNPATTADESEDSEDGFFTYSTKVSNNWVTEIYAENGEIVVTACNPTSAMVSGTFNTTSLNLVGGSDLTITEGKFTDIKYTVVN